MSRAISDPSPAQSSRSRLSWINRLMASRSFQKWAAGFPLTRGFVRREGQALFDLMAGFAHSQVLMGVVKLDLPKMLMDGPLGIKAIAHRTGVPADRLVILLRAAEALGLLVSRDDVFHLAPRGVALQTVPGLDAMIRHHEVLYRDLEDPVAFFKGQTEPELAGFWPYVFGGDMEPEVAETYSALMADSQALVAEDTLRAVSLRGVSRLMDVGGGSGAFLSEVAKAYPALELMLFDLPEVVPVARERFVQMGAIDQLDIRSGSFKTDALPSGADAISLTRILFDHSDATVSQLLDKCFAALPSGGRLIISEPMLGQDKPSRAGDAYFALYTLAMSTGKTRSANEIRALCEKAGFVKFRMPKPVRPFVTSCLDMSKP